MAENQIASVSDRHEAIITFMIANPEMKKKDIAEHFGYTQPWLSTMIHSHAFQRRLKERQEDFYSAAVRPLQDKLNAIAHKSLDKVEDMLDANAILDVNVLQRVAEMAMDRLGVGRVAAASPGGSLSINLEGDSELALIISSARKRILSTHPEVIEGEFKSHLSTPEEVPAGGNSQESRALPPPTTLRLPEGERERSESAGELL